MYTQVNGVPARRRLARAALCALFATVFLGGGALAQAPETPDADSEQSGEGSGAEAEEGRWDDRWVPSFALTSGITWQEQKASVMSRDLTNDEPLRPSDQDQEDVITPYVGFNIELLTPAVEPGEPRLFANFEFLGQFGQSLDIAREGNPKGIDRPVVTRLPIVCDPDRGGDPTSAACFDARLPCFWFEGCYEEELIEGVGSKTTAEMKIPTYAAALGVAFPFEFLERKIYIKPSIGWFNYSVHVDGRVLRSIKPDGDIFGTPTQLPDVRDIVLEAGTSESFHAIGPGIEIEMDTGRQGPFEPALYFGAQFYRVVGDRRVDFSRTESISGCTEQSPIGCSIPDATYRADWTWKAEPWIYRFGVGMRFRWVGFD